MVWVPVHILYVCFADGASRQHIPHHLSNDLFGTWLPYDVQNVLGFTGIRVLFNCVFIILMLSNVLTRTMAHIKSEKNGPTWKVHIHGWYHPLDVL